MQLMFENSASKTLRNLDKTLQKRILTAIKGLLQIPAKDDIKPMEGYPKGTYRLRIGHYRIIYVVLDESIVIQDIGARGDIYK